LADKGYFKGSVDGRWAPDSVDALRRFQADQSLEPDGKLGALSLIALGLGPKRLSAQSTPATPQATIPR
jgi:peptidoglycan hydrolase-like protein with peptidoglycan-binding domain